MLHNKKKKQTVRHACVPSPLHFYRIHLSDSRKWLHVGSYFYFFYKPLGSGSHSKQFRGRKDYRRTLFFTDSSEKIVQFLTKRLGLPGSPSSENGASQPKRHRNQDLPSSQDVKPSKEAETSRGRDKDPQGIQITLTHTQGPSVQLWVPLNNRESRGSHQN